MVWALAVLVLGAIVSFVVFGRSRAADRAGASATVKPRPAVSPVPVNPPPGSFQAAGYVVARRKATVAAEVAGRLLDVEVEEGDRVAAGQVLARLDAADAHRRLRISQTDLASARQGLEEVQAQVKSARQTLERSERLHREQLITDDAIVTARLNLEQLDAREQMQRLKVESSRNTLELTEAYVGDHVIRAPFAGVVIQRSAQQGEYISPQSAGGAFTRTGLCTIVDTSSIEGEVDVNEVYIHRIQIGQPVQATLNAYPNWQIPGRVLAIVPTGDRQTATVKVRIRFDQLDDRMLPDMPDRHPPARTGGLPCRRPEAAEGKQRRCLGCAELRRGHPRGAAQERAGCRARRPPRHDLRHADPHHADARPVARQRCR
jgi:RND family efflux transporter MFP subunit